MYQFLVHFNKLCLVLYINVLLFVNIGLHRKDCYVCGQTTIIKQHMAANTVFSEVSAEFLSVD